MGARPSASAPKSGCHVLKVVFHSLRFSLSHTSLQVQPGSPGDAAGLISFFDFIVQVNGLSLVSPNDRNYKDRN